MNIADTLRGLVRRWYIVVPGLAAAIAVALGTFLLISPGYQRTATQMLLPGEGSVPPGASNPYLYLGGLTQAADIVVRVMQSDEVVGPIAERFPGTQIEVQRDPMVSGPSIELTVTASSDAAAAGALSAMVNQTAVVLERLQVQQNVTSDDRMSVSTLTEDQHSTLQQKNRLVASAAVGIALVVFTLLLASFVDGLMRRVRRSGRHGLRKRSTATVDGDGDPLSIHDVEDPFPADDLTVGVDDSEVSVDDGARRDADVEVEVEEDPHSLEVLAGGSGTGRAR